MAGGPFFFCGGPCPRTLSARRSGGCPGRAAFVLRWPLLAGGGGCWPFVAGGRAAVGGRLRVGVPAGGRRARCARFEVFSMLL